VGYNVEWSQELKLEASLEEYVKGAMLIKILVASGRLELPEGCDDVLFDMSVGYDLKGIQSPRVQQFLQGMRDPTEVVNRLRRELTGDLRPYRDLDYPDCLSNTLTLSTFHGCPPGEIEDIMDFLLRELELHAIVKLNPTLLGPEMVRHLMQEVMGYEDIVVPEAAFERDASWDQVVGMMDRLGQTAQERGLGLGVKFTNTLIVENHRDFFPSTEKQMYLSGPPLHVLAMNLVGKFRAQFGDRFPISFSAGIDRRNFPDAVSLGLVPITVCSDLLKTGGYGRLEAYFRSLASRMDGVGARTIDDFIIRAHGQGLKALEAAGGAEHGSAGEALERGGDLLAAAGPELYAGWVREARLRNTAMYVEAATVNPRYAKAANSKSPRKIGSHLVLLDCITCDKCVPVCPNDAIFRYTIPPTEVPVVRLEHHGDGWKAHEEGTITVAKKHQLASFADFCNDCGNCDVFCPEEGGPYRMKARFFSTEALWRAHGDQDGFFLGQEAGGRQILGRFQGVEYALHLQEEEARYSSLDFEIHFHPDRPEVPIGGRASQPVDLTYYHLMRLISAAILDGEDVTYLNA